MSDAIENFLDELAKSLSSGSFVRLMISNYKGAQPDLQKIAVRMIETKKGRRVSVQKRLETRETVKNYDIGNGIEVIREFLAAGFRNAHLFTTSGDFQLTIGKKRSRVVAGKATFPDPASKSHDREKRSLIDRDAYYLKALGVTADDGSVRGRQQDKWRQINKYLEILRDLFDRSALGEDKQVRIVDMGSGKGYLTFAAYDYFANVRGLNIEMTGVDERTELVELCNQIADAAGFAGLKFANGTIADFDAGNVDVLIALHACDTATDDALFKGIAAGAKVIVAAPCCHKEIRKQLKPPEVLRDILKHGSMLEREAETITDGLRSMLLEMRGYQTRVFEFVPIEHTPKNNMIAAVRRRDADVDRQTIRKRIDAVKSFYGITDQRLENRLCPFFNDKQDD